MKGTDKRCPNSAEAFAVPASTNTPRFFFQGILILANVPLSGLVVRLSQVTHLNQGILDALIAVYILALIQVMLVVTSVFASVVAISWMTVLGGVIRVLNGSWREGLIIPAAMVCPSAITALIKEFAEGIRPASPEHLVVEGSYSFPSRRATAVATACAMGVLLTLHHLANRILDGEDGSFPRSPVRTIRGFITTSAIILIVLTAFTRLYLGAHQFSGVVVGALVGMASSLIVAKLLLGST